MGWSLNVWVWVYRVELWFFSVPNITCQSVVLQGWSPHSRGMWTPYLHRLLPRVMGKVNKSIAHFICSIKCADHSRQYPRCPEQLTVLNTFPNYVWWGKQCLNKPYSTLTEAFGFQAVESVIWSEIFEPVLFWDVGCGCQKTTLRISIKVRKQFWNQKAHYTLHKRQKWDWIGVKKSKNWVAFAESLCVYVVCCFLDLPKPDPKGVSRAWIQQGSNRLPWGSVTPLYLL